MSEFKKAVLFVVAALCCLAIFIWASNELWEMIVGIEDPTERGFAYLALAIVIHTFFGRHNVEIKQR